MDSSAMQPHHQFVVDRFIATCQADARIVAAFLGGSYARGAADAHSDLDLYLITADEAHANFCAAREAFMRLLGEPLFLEDFNLPDIVFFIFADGTEGELGLGRESRFMHIHDGPYKILLDKKNILADAVFPARETAPSKQRETLRKQIYWFWHELSHFITAMARGQLWWAYGQLEALRRHSVTLARLRHDFAADAGDDESYFKVEKALPIALLSPLRETFCPQERAAMLRAAHIIFQFYREQAMALASAHGVTYPTQLEWVMVERLKNLEFDRAMD